MANVGKMCEPRATDPALGVLAQTLTLCIS